MTSENYRQLLIAERDSLEMTNEDFDSTLMHFAMLYHKEQLSISHVVDSEAELCGKPNCNRQKLDNSPLCSYHWDIANS